MLKVLHLNSEGSNNVLFQPSLISSLQQTATYQQPKIHCAHVCCPTTLTQLPGTVIGQILQWDGKYPVVKWSVEARCIEEVRKSGNRYRRAPDRSCCSTLLQCPLLDYLVSGLPLWNCGICIGFLGSHENGFVEICSNFY